MRERARDAAAERAARHQRERSLRAREGLGCREPGADARAADRAGHGTHEREGEHDPGGGEGFRQQQECKAAERAADDAGDGASGGRRGPPARREAPRAAQAQGHDGDDGLNPADTTSERHVAGTRHVPPRVAEDGARALVSRPLIEPPQRLRRTEHVELFRGVAAIVIRRERVQQTFDQRVAERHLRQLVGSVLPRAGRSPRRRGFQAAPCLPMRRAPQFAL